MTTLREAAQQALEALNEVTGWQSLAPQRVMDEVEEAITALRAALEQPEQEPVILHRELVEIHPDGTETWSETPLYTHPPRREWRGLTEEGLAELARQEELLLICDDFDALREIARAIEAALKEKNHDQP